MAPVSPRHSRAARCGALAALLALAVTGCGGGPVTAAGSGTTAGTASTPGGTDEGSTATDGSPGPSDGSAGPGDGSNGGAGGSGGASSGSASTASGRTLGTGPAGATGSGAPVPWETSGPGVQQLPASLPSASSGPASLTILLDDGFGVRTTWTLTCEPAGGTHPTPRAACGVLGAKGATALPAPRDGAVCTQQYGGPQKAKLTGSWRGKKVSAELSLENGCQITRWTALLGLLPQGGVSS